jgi:uncharacterized protein
MPARKTPSVEDLLHKVDALIDRVDALLPQPSAAPNWKALAYRWRRRNGVGSLIAIDRPHRIRLKDLCGIDNQKAAIDRNTAQFLRGRPANNVLLTGARGTGKSSLIKALLHEYAKQGLRLIEVDKADLIDLPDIVDLVADRAERFVIFCDDLSFEAGEAAYKALKVVLDGSIAATSENVLIYATSNRRHLMPEFMRENLEYKHVGEEIHPGESSEEKISLSERFGLWLSFYPFDQDEYLLIVAHWLKEMGSKETEGDIAKAREAALQWALQRGSRSGRVAWQFARDWAGQHKRK